MKCVSGNLVDIYSESIYPASIIIEGDSIVEIRKEDQSFSNYIVPGFVDSHVHIESSMLVPAEFSRMAVQHGTVATVSDPHEIANVLGLDGVRFMIENGKHAALKFFWAIPSCVPATTFETSGATLTVHDMEELIKHKEVVALAEMMNFPGVIYDDSDVLAKLRFAREHKLPVDGHAPGLSGDSLTKYIGAGISTDHECSSMDEAIEKMKKGMKILIRNGSSAKNFASLASLVDLYPNQVMFCCDDIHPDDLVKGHINLFLKWGVKRGLNLFHLIRASSLNAVQHYNLPLGMLRVGDKADFAIVDNLKDFAVNETWIDGERVFSKSTPLESQLSAVVPLNRFNASSLSIQDIRVSNQRATFKAIGVIDGELLTENLEIENNQTGEFLSSDTSNDVLKIVVVNRYTGGTPSVAFIRGFGLKQGAIASTVAHDSHNIIAVGVDDENIVAAINAIIKCKGGIVVVNGEEQLVLPLSVAGLMSTASAESVASMYEKLHSKAKEYGSPLSAPFMTLSFMALLVIPELKISDKGLFDSKHFQFTSLFV